MFKLSSNRKGMIFSPNGKSIMAPMEHTPWFVVSMKKVWFYKRFFFEVVMVMVKDKIKYNKKINANKINVTSSFQRI